MSRPVVSARQFVVVVLIVWGAVMAAGCGGTASSAASTARPSVPPTAAAPAPTTAATASSTVTVTPEPPPPSLEPPPVASLAVEGGDPVPGSLGSFTWGGGGSDSPWLPGAPIAVGAGESLTLTLAGDVPVKTWTAKRVRAGTTDGAGAVTMGDGQATPITFTVPGPGRWSVQVEVTFDDDLGSAAYYWEVTAS